MASKNQITQYYLHQAGGGGISHYYAGAPYQKGYGIGSWLGGLFRSVLPLLKRGAVAVGKEAARAGSHVLSDVAMGENLKGSINKHAEEAMDNLKRKAQATMRGSGSIKRRKKTQGNHSDTVTRKKRTSTVVKDYLT